MDRTFYFLVSIKSDDCNFDYVVSDFSKVGVCIEDYLSDCPDYLLTYPLDIHITQVVWKGGIEGEKKNEKQS